MGFEHLGGPVRLLAVAEMDITNPYLFLVKDGQVRVWSLC